MLPCLALSIIRWGSRVKWGNSGNGIVPSPTSRCCSYRMGAFGSPSTKVANLLFIVLKLPCDPHNDVSSPAYFTLAMVYIHTMLVLHWSLFTPTHCLFSVVALLILSMARCICQLHMQCSSQVKAIYYNRKHL